MRHRKRICISILSKLGLVDQSKPCILIYLQKMASCINLQLPIVILKISIISDMHYRKTYMYISFQQNRVSRSVKTCTQIYLQKIVSCINLQLAIRILKKSLLSDMHDPITNIQADFVINRLITV